MKPQRDTINRISLKQYYELKRLSQVYGISQVKASELMTIAFKNKKEAEIKKMIYSMNISRKRRKLLI